MIEKRGYDHIDNAVNVAQRAHDSRILACFGDSWSHGSELTANENTFGKLLAIKYNFPVFYNGSVPGSSVDSTLLQLRHFYKKYLDRSITENNNDANTANNKTTAIFFLTGKSRSITWKNGGFTGIRPSMINEYKYASHYYKHIHHSKLDYFRTNQNLLALQRCCSVLGIDDYYIFGFTKEILDFPGIDMLKIYDNGMTDCSDFFGGDYSPNNYYVSPNKNHPNQLGHQLIADKLDKWIRF